MSQHPTADASDAVAQRRPSPGIDVISMEAWARGTPGDRDTIVAAIGAALSDIGFFAVEDHGVERALIDRAYALTAQLFALPDAAKAAYDIPMGAGQRGFTSFGREHAKAHGAPDLKEFWHVGREFAPDHPAYLTLRRNVWPHEIEGFRHTMLELYQALDRLADELLMATAIFLGESPTFLREMTRDGDTILRLIHYPPVPPDAHPASVRAAAHEDINLLTVLCEATAGGLELLQHDGNWRPIHALGGQLIVDAGDMIQHLSNGLLRSTTHRVVNPDNSRQQRFSMPFFVHPRGDADLTPRPASVARTGGEPRFASMTAAQFLHQRLVEIGLA